jgi:hypothetical protein
VPNAGRRVSDRHNSPTRKFRSPYGARYSDTL